MIEYNISSSRLQLLPGFRSIVWQTELKDLLKRYACPVHFANMQIDSGLFDFFYNKVVENRNRRGEVCLAVIRDDEVLLHTKHKYPPNIYRLPTGGINYDESVLKALHREVHEETGLTVNHKNLESVLLYELVHQRRRVPFASYMFTVVTEPDKPQPVDEGEGISGFKWVPISDLENVVGQLENIKGEWKIWGQFRALAHKILMQYD